MRKSTAKNLIRVILAIVLLVVCLATFCACHVFAWYIPKPYNDKQMAKIYECLKNELDDASHIIATVGYKQDGLGYYYSIFADEGKTIVRYEVYGEAETLKRGLFYDGTLKEWDVESRTETVASKDLSDYGFLLERVNSAAEYFKTEVLDVMPYREDSYC